MKTIYVLLNESFFSDHSLTDIPKLRMMLDEIEPIYSRPDLLSHILRGIKGLWAPEIRMFTAAALLMVVLFPSWQTICVLIMSIISAIYMGIIGRPGIVRVYMPIAFLLLIAPFIQNIYSKKLNGFIFIFLVFISSFYTYNLFSEHLQLQKKAEVIQESLVDMDLKQVATWGSPLKFEYAYNVYGTDQSIRQT